MAESGTSPSLEQRERSYAGIPLEASIDRQAGSSILDQPLLDQARNPVPGTWYERHEVEFTSNPPGKEIAHTIRLDLDANPNLRLYAYYDGQPRRIKGGQQSWFNRYGRGVGAFLLTSGTFFNFPGDADTPFGDVVGPLTPDAMAGPLIRERHRCWLGLRTDQQPFRFGIGYRGTEKTLARISPYFPEGFMSGFGWLVFEGQNAIHVSRAQATQTFVINGKTLFGQQFLPDVYRASTAHIAAAVDRSLRQMVFIVTEYDDRRAQAGWMLDQVSEWLLGGAFIPGTNRNYRFTSINVGSACFFDQGRTTEVYLPYQAGHQLLPVGRIWGRPGTGERPQPSCWIVVQVP